MSDDIANATLDMVRLRLRGASRVDVNWSCPPVPDEERNATSMNMVQHFKQGLVETITITIERRQPNDEF